MMSVGFEGWIEATLSFAKARFAVVEVSTADVERWELALATCQVSGERSHI